MPTVPPEALPDGETSSIVSPKKSVDPEDFAFHHPEIQNTVDQYEELVEVTVEAAKAEDECDEDAYRHDFIPYCG
jgi:vacuolar-type H+-ATPase subunit D/Vma8